jgi:hypothetical protein
MPDQLQIARQRLVQVFRYLQALNERRYPPVRQVSQHAFVLKLTGLPQHPCINFNTESAVLAVRRPVKAAPPLPPESLEGWIVGGFSDPHTEPIHRPLVVRTVASEEVEELFEDDPYRSFDWQEWIVEWQHWAAKAIDDLRVERLYQQLYEQRALMERDGERFEMVLGDGLLNWRLTEGGVHHPVLLKRVELEFDAANTQISVVETAYPVELYTSPLRGSSIVLPSVLAQLRNHIEGADWIHPLDGEATTDFLRGLAASLHQDGEFLDVETLQGERDYPRVVRSPMLITRSKAFGMAQALEQILEDLPTRPHLPAGLLQLVGIESANGVSVVSGPGFSGMADEDEESFFTKPANIEQLRIVKRLNASGAVLVQGPPGTGKTHTIANLIGHLLAQGKSVLVTSHTTKALRVVRDQVVQPLRPLCVSVLQSDRQSRDQLEASVQEIAERLGANDNSMADRVTHLRARRAELIRRLRDLRSKGLLTSPHFGRNELFVSRF